MLGMISEDMKDFYELLNAEQYTEEMGLILEVEPGKALFKWHRLWEEEYKGFACLRAESKGCVKNEFTVFTHPFPVQDYSKSYYFNPQVFSPDWKKAYQIVLIYSMIFIEKYIFGKILFFNKI